MKEQTLLCYRMKRYEEEIKSAIDKYSHTDITLVLENKMQKKYFLNNEMEECIIKVITVEELLNGEIDNMKFDHVIGNPPYQRSIDGGKTEQIWPELTLKFASLLKEGGDYHMLHPGNWKTSNKKEFKSVKKMYSENKIIFMKFNDYAQGFKTFGVNTDYDEISMVKKNEKGKSRVLTVDFDGEIDVSEFNIIPTLGLKHFLSLKAKLDEERVEILYSRSAYGTDKTNTSDTKTEKFKHPVIYGQPVKGIKYVYANSKDKGHFGIPKLIIANASTNSILDLNGEFGMSQFAQAIVDKPDNLIRIQKVMETDKMRELKTLFCGLGNVNRNAIIDAQGNMFKFIAEFRKDFWKEFYTDEMEQELIKEGKIDG